MEEALNPNLPELASTRIFKAQVQAFQRSIEHLPEPMQPLIARSLSTVLNQLEAVLDPQTLSASIAERHQEEQWLALSTCLPFGIVSCDVQGRCTYINSRCEEIIGRSREESVGDRWLNFVHPDDRDRVLSPWIEDAKAGRPHSEQFRITTARGETRWLYVRTAPMFSANGELVGHTGTIEDITSQKLVEEQIQASLREKEALLKEIHHRVKNNLQVISSLIYLQAQRISDPKVKQIFEDSQSRISSMALVHDSLYRSQDFANINLSEYVQTLTSQLFHTYCVQPESVNLRLDVEPQVVVSLEKAIPCGLILNELMTNALKHGFIDQEAGEVIVTLTKHQSQISLAVENGGKNLPESFELQEIRSMGLRLVNALVSQLNGQVTVEKFQNTRFKVSFDCV
ncbi:MAG TPA: histidine kinase dimerization/phosphoacceptor domain -containing protein [Leptolyngbya sp.]|jgi:PAS domain S-box-containing protein|nr:histidine kinase dimerization/phosphoacceptor domain -containing protein [Leptolyngbya sp.]